MKKSLAITASIAAIASLGLAGAASASQRPATGLASLGSDVAGSAATYDEFMNLVAGSASGDITLEIDQTGVSAGPIVMADIDLGDGFTIDSVASVTVVSNEDTGTCGENAVVSISGDHITVKGFACSDTDADGTVEFSVIADDIVASTTKDAVGDYEIDSQYRTNGSRKVKAQTWVVENELGISLGGGVA